MFNIIFPSRFENINRPDFAWETEAQSAKENNFVVSFLYEGLFGDTTRISKLYDGYKNLYRGWILKPERYQQMCNILDHNIITDYDSYMWSYNFSSWYNSLQESTPFSICIDKSNIDKYGLDFVVNGIKDIFNDSPLFVKDFLKSRKHEWYDACFIRDASDSSEVLRVVNNLISLQGTDFHGGLVFRNFLELKKIGVHAKSKMPLPLEFRVFFLNKIPIFCTPYWNDGATYPNNNIYPPKDWLHHVGSKLQSPFVALDIAQDIKDKWWVIEVNDGGSAGLPDHVDTKQFYNLLHQSLNTLQFFT